MKRSTAYLAFESLEAKGLLGSVAGTRGRLYRATPPSVLVHGAEERLASLRAALPVLEALRSKDEARPYVASYEGKQGYVTAVEDMLSQPRILVRFIGSISEIQRVIGQEYDLHYVIPARIKRGIGFRSIYPVADQPNELLTRDVLGALREVRYVANQTQLQTSTMIYRDTVVFFSTTVELMTIIIRSPAIAETERQKFDLLWDLIGPAKKKPIATKRSSAR